MGQFILGLAAGIIVGLIMEWVIDWSGLLPKRSPKSTVDKGNQQRPAQGMAAPHETYAEAQAPPDTSSSLNYTDTSGT